MDLSPGGNADGGFACRPDIIQVNMAVVSLKSFKKTSGDSVEVEDSPGEGRHAINSPVSQPIAYHGSCQVNVVKRGIEFSLEIVLVDLPSKVRHVDSSITLSTHEELVFLEFRELGVPDFESVDGVLRLDHIVGGHVLVGRSERVADTSRTFEPHDIGLRIPGVGIVLDLCFAIIYNPRSVLLHEAEHGGASGTTIEPDNHGVVGGVSLRLSESVVETLGVRDVEVARVSSSVECLSIG